MMTRARWIPGLVVVVVVAIASAGLGVDLGWTGAVKGVGKGIKIEKIEKVSVPGVPAGPAVAVTGSAQTYTTGGASSSLGHTVEYRFNWGDGAYSSWGTGTSASHAWSAGGTCSVMAEARCQTHTAVTAVSPGLSVAIAVDAGTEVLIPAGSFNMGDSYFSDAVPVHSVYLDAYYVDKYEVTFDQYDAFCTATSRTAASDSGFGRGSRPVINITWYDAQAYCAWAGKRLATEAEWERACRAGTDTAFYWGDDPGGTLVGNYAWYSSNSGSMTQPVGGKLPNAFGLYDMSGNVWEWVADWYDSGYYSVSPSSNPPGPASGTYKVLRGGSWGIGLDGLRSAYRGDNDPANSGLSLGCRCARTP